jgi:hypothetical protein
MELTKLTKMGFVGFVGSPSGQVSITEGSSNVVEVPQEQNVTLVPIACRCSARRYPHIHSPEDHRRSIVAWNRDSTHKIEPIQ